jgi:methylenetetrahydrofolate reductase (NADPH)
VIDIPELYASAKRPVYSFEFFLPKAPEDLDAFVATVRGLKDQSPDFVTLTYGAGGSARARTVEAAGRLQSETGLTTVCHLTCVAHTRAEILAILDRLSALGIGHLVALRGDKPKDAGTPAGIPELTYAADLVRLVRSRGGFKMGVAGYPEKHPESPSADEDLRRFAEKVAAGGDWGITQLFFDEADYFAFVKRARAAGVKVPIVPGIMPVTGYAQLKRFTALCGTRIPAELDARLAAAQDDPAKVAAIGVEWATKQCRALLAGGAPGIHFYTLNRSGSTAEVLARLRRA